MAKKRKITRKKLLKEPDEFITTTGRLIAWSRKHQAALLYGAGAFFVVLIGIAGFRYMASRAENNAFRLISQTVANYEAHKNTENAAAAYQEVKHDFETIIKRYNHRKAARLARMIFADLSLKAGNTDQAIALYERVLKALSQESTLTNFIESSLGYAYEKKGDLAQAIHFFQTIASGSDPVLKENAFFNLGRLYAKAGDAAKSKEAYQQVVSNYTDSIYYEIAKEKVAG